jgi:hypothetical protein
MKWSEAETYRYLDVTGLESRTCRSREMDLQTPPGSKMNPYGSNTNHPGSNMNHPVQIRTTLQMTYITKSPELLLKQTILAR